MRKDVFEKHWENDWAYSLDENEGIRELKKATW